MTVTTPPRPQVSVSIEKLKETSSRVVEDLMKDVVASFSTTSRNLMHLNENDIRTRLCCLDILDKNKLRERLEPILNDLCSIDAEHFLALERVSSDGAKLKDGICVKPIHQDIVPHLTGLKGNSIRYIHIAEIPDHYSMGIFIFPPHTIIPLHDHPQMAVLSRLLYGDVDVQSYDIVSRSSDEQQQQKISHKDDDSNVNNSTPSANVNPNNKISWLANLLPSVKHIIPSPLYRSESDTSSCSSDTTCLSSSIPGSLIVHRNESYNLSAPNVSILFPHQGNLHEFSSGMHGAAILDVILPPYDPDQNRDCTFYQIGRSDKPTTRSGKRLGKNREIEQVRRNHRPEENCMPWDDIHPTEPARNVCCVVPVAAPSDFHCISGRYLHLGCTKEDTGDCEQTEMDRKTR